MTVKEEVIPTRAELSGSQRAALEERLRRAKQRNARPPDGRGAIPRRAGGAPVPLSFGQERLWFLDRLEPGAPVYNVAHGLRLRGRLNVTALERALNEIVRRHEALRTNFVAAEGQPVPVIAAERTLRLARMDVSARPPAEAEEALRQRLREEARRPFDLARDLLVRALLARTAEGDHTLLLTVHHIVFDGWSAGVVFRELAALYDAFNRGRSAALPELPIQYADYARWEREQMQGAALQRLLAFWRRQLHAPLPVLELPADHLDSAAAPARGDAQTLTLPRPLAEALQALSQREGATLFMTLLAAFQVLLHRWSGQDDLLVGSVVAGRRRSELENLVGFFVNTVVFRGDLSGDPTFRQLLARTREVALAVLAHQDLPFERLVNEVRPSRSVSRNPLFQAMFVLQNAPMATGSLAGLELQPLELTNGTSKFDLTLAVTESADGLRAAIEYNANRFEADTIGRMLQGWATLLHGIVADPDEAVSRLPILTPAERRRLLVDWNNTDTAYPRHATVDRLFEQQARATPAAIALAADGGTLTYAELDARANRLARRLRARGVKPRSVVALGMERSSEAIVALLGILKAGAAYVSLDPGYPVGRLAAMLRDTAAPVVLTQPALRERFDAVARAANESGGAQDRAAGPVVFCLDSAGSDRANESTAPLGVSADAEAPAYISFTSGSTGAPKGVCVPHRAIVRLVRNTDYAAFGPAEVFLHFAPIAFDASTFEIWGALLNGARLAIHPPGLPSLSQLGEYIERAGVTTLWLTAGLFRQMVEEQLPRLRNVRQLLAGGDVLAPAQVRRVLEELPGLRLINGYGPTENTTFTCCHTLTHPPAAGRSVPIGRPIANTRVYILDPHGQPTPIGVPGELYAAGAGLALGYLGRPDLTAARFVPDPFAAQTAPDGQAARMYRTGDRARWLPDGTIEFLGRLDRQVKIRGHRVEPGEVESVLALHPGVKDCAVIARPGPDGENRLVAYVVRQPGAPADADGWRDHLAGRLPEYLVPSEWHGIEALPLSPNGKLDLAALPVDDAAGGVAPRAPVAPRDDLERRLVEIWEEVLGVRRIGIHDPFFALGGHSLLAVRLVARLEKNLGVTVPVAAIFQHRTIAELARHLRSPRSGAGAASAIVEINAQGARPPLYFVHGVGGGMFWGYANLARHLGNGQPVYAFKSRGLDGLPEWPTIEEMAAQYVADLQRHQPHGPYLLGGYCFGGIVAFEMARQLRARGEPVALLALINGSPPNTSYQRAADRWSPVWAAKFLGNLAYWLGCFLFRWSWRERMEFVRWKLRVWRRRSGPAPGQAQVALGDVDQLVDLAAFPEDRRALWRAHVQALVKYQPKPYDGRVALIRTRGHPLFSSFDPRYGWGELARGVDVRIVAGGHGNVLAEPYVGSVARALRSCLEDATAKTGWEGDS